MSATGWLRCGIMRGARQRIRTRYSITMPAGIPNRRLTNELLLRSARNWLLLRTAAGGLLLLAGSDPLHLPIATMIVIAVLCTAVGYVEVHRNHEGILFANLGIAPQLLTPYFLSPVILGEVCIRLVVSHA